MIDLLILLNYIMASIGKKFLVVLEINNILFYLNNPRTSTPLPPHIPPVKYDSSINNLSMLTRRGKSQLLNYLFQNLRDDIDVAVWSSLGSDLTNELCHKHFTRYYRDLLFVLATNRALYGSHPQHTPIRIRKNLSDLYSRFPSYNEGNTIVVTAQDNLIEQHQRNDLKVPQFCPTSPDFLQDAGIVPLAKYLSGLVLLKNQSGISDIRRFINAKQATNIFKRASHNLYTQRKYL